MRDPLSIPQEDLITEATAALRALNGYDPNIWGYKAIAKQLAEVTGRKVDESNGRRFILQIEKPIVFSLLELHQVHKFAIEAKTDYERDIRGISLATEFNPKSNMLEINLSAEQATLVAENPQLRSFIEGSVHSAIDLFASSIKAKDHEPS